MKSLQKSAGTFSVIVGLVLSLMISSCIKDTVDMSKISNTVDWPVAYGMPVAYGSLSVGDIVSVVDNNGYVQTDKDGLLYLIYHDHVISQTATDLLTIPDNSYPQTLALLPKDLPAIPTQFDSIKISKHTSFVFNFNKNDAKVDSIKFKSGSLNVTTSTSLVTLQNRVDITFPNMKKNGVPFKIRNNAPAASIEGYSLKFKNGGNNRIAVHYDIVIFNNKTAIPGGQSVTADIKFASAGFSSIFGYLGQIPNLLNLINQKITIDLFTGSNNYNVLINNPSINLCIANSFGIPIQMQISNTKTYSDKTSSFFPITFTPPTIQLKSPTISQVGSTIFDTIPITSNILNSIPTSPHYFYYTENAIANPLGNIGGSNFFTDSSKVNVDMELKLPFDLKAGNLETTDTIDFDLGKTIRDFSIVKKIGIYNTFSNSIPFNLSLQVFLADNNKVIIDSLFTIAQQPLVKSGIDDGKGTGHYTFSNSTTMSVFFDNARAQNLKKVKYAIMKAGISTDGGGTKYVKFYSDYRLNCAFQVQTELVVKSLNQF